MQTLMDQYFPRVLIERAEPHASTWYVESASGTTVMIVRHKDGLRRVIARDTLHELYEVMA